MKILSKRRQRVHKSELRTGKGKGPWLKVRRRYRKSLFRDMR